MEKNYNGDECVSAESQSVFHVEQAARSDIPAVMEFVEAQLKKFNFPVEDAIAIINIAVDEIFSNIVRHGYPERPGPVTVSVYKGTQAQTALIRFEDEGIPYDPLAKADPDITLSIEKRSYGGMGIFMVKKMMDDVKYKYEDGKNVLTIAKRF